MHTSTEHLTVADVARSYALRILRQVSAESIHQLLSSAKEGTFDGKDPRASFYPQLVIGNGSQLSELDEEEVKVAVENFKSMIIGVKQVPEGGHDVIDRFCLDIERGETASTNEKLALLAEWCEEALNEIGA